MTIDIVYHHHNIVIQSMTVVIIVMKRIVSSGYDGVCYYVAFSSVPSISICRGAYWLKKIGV